MTRIINLALAGGNPIFVFISFQFSGSFLLADLKELVFSHPSEFRITRAFTNTNLKAIMSHCNLKNVLEILGSKGYIFKSEEQPPIEPNVWQQPFSFPTTMHSGEASTSQTWLPTGEWTVSDPRFEEHVLDSWKWINDFDKKQEKGKGKVGESECLEPTNLISTPLRPPVSNTTRPLYKRHDCNKTIVIYGVEINLWAIPTPYCSCTGTPVTCRRWNSKGYQSKCCTAFLSQYPLPIVLIGNTRMQGRKMGNNSFKYLVEELELEDYDFREPIDLTHRWVKMGVHKYKSKRKEMNS